MKAVVRRGIFHICFGMVIALSGLFLPRDVVVITLGVLLLLGLAMELTRFANPAVNMWFFRVFRPFVREAEATSATGALYMVMASFLAYLAFETHIAMLAIAFLAIGDAVGAIVGHTVGRTKSLKKTLEGDMACFLSCIAIGFIFYFSGLVGDMVIIIVGSVSAAVIEAIPLPVNDNFMMPLFSGFVMSVV
jgi:dolichol kinase